MYVPLKAEMKEVYRMEGLLVASPSLRFVPARPTPIKIEQNQVYYSSFHNLLINCERPNGLAFVFLMHHYLNLHGVDRRSELCPSGTRPFRMNDHYELQPETKC